LKEKSHEHRRKKCPDHVGKGISLGMEVEVEGWDSQARETNITRTGYKENQIFLICRDI
jgi:hypothetical protein